jgi:hypothetical protein
LPAFGQERQSGLSNPPGRLRRQDKETRRWRDIPGAGSLEREQLRGAAAKSNGMLCEDEESIKKHAEISGFPATKITEVRKMIDPPPSIPPERDDSAILKVTWN